MVLPVSPLASLSAMALLLSTANVTPAPQPADPDLATVIRTGQDDSSRVTIPISIAGKGPYPFVIDTGSQRTVISRQLATALALQTDAPVRIVSMAGLSDVQTVMVPRLSFGRGEMAPIQAPVLEGGDLGAAGLLGLDGLQSKRLLLDFKRGKMSISPSRSSQSDSDDIVVRARSRFGQLLLLDSAANGQKVTVILDTGTQNSVGNMALLRKLTRKKAIPLSEPTTMVDVTGQTLTGQWALVRNITVGKVELNNIPVFFLDARPFDELQIQDKPSLLLGINVLRMFDRVEVDFGRRQVHFQLPDRAEDRPPMRMAVR